MHKINKAIIIAIIIIASPNFSFTQEESRDSIPESIDLKIVEKEKHNPKVAGLLSLVPGGGQVYNKKYWKIPIIYGAFGSFLFFAQQNNTRYHEYLEEYAAYGLPGPTYFFDQERQLEELEYYKKYYRRNRDRAWIFMGFTYMLNIVDAIVDAHLFNYDVGDDLTLNFSPTYLNTKNNLNTFGIQCSIRLK